MTTISDFITDIENDTESFFIRHLFVFSIKENKYKYDFFAQRLVDGNILATNDEHRKIATLLKA